MRDKKDKPELSRFCAWVIRKIFKDDKETKLGDFAEVYADLTNGKDRFKARLKFRGYLFYSIPKYINDSLLIGVTMFLNYIKITFRNFKRNKTVSFINIFGLVLSITISLYIYLHISHELSYDNYHEHGDRIYRIVQEREAETATNFYAQISGNVAMYLESDYPEVERAGRIMHSREDNPVKIGDVTFMENNLAVIDPDIFDILTIPIIKGDTRNPLDEASDVMICESLAYKYFGNDDPIGKTINVNGEDVIVSGIIKDPPDNTHMKMNMLFSFKMYENNDWIQNWTLVAVFTYLKLRENTDVKDFEEKAYLLADNYIKDYLQESNQKYKYHLQPVKDIHLNSHLQYEAERPGNRLYVNIFSIIAVLIITIAGMNYTNIMNAKVLSRAKESLVRKLVGAKQNQILKQLLSETAIVFFVSFLISLAVLFLLLPLFNSILGTDLKFAGLISIPSLLLMILIIFTAALGGGIIPASIIASLKPARIMKLSSSKFTTKSSITKFIVFSQFFISIILIIFTVVVYRQINFMKKSNLGFNTQRKFIIEAQSIMSIPEDYKLIKNELSRIPGVQGVTASHRVPGNSPNTLHVRLLEDRSKGYEMAVIFCDFDFIPEYGLELAAGRGFDKNIQTDIAGAFIINESAVKEFGFSDPEKLLGKRMFLGNGHRNEIIGVVKNFHYQGLQSEIRPLVMEVDPGRFNRVTVTILSEDLPGVVSRIEEEMSKLAPETSFNYRFLDDLFNEQYRQEEAVGTQILSFTLFGIFVACLGPFGLVFLVTQNKAKEIGIRKVLGASPFNILLAISKEFVVLMIITNIVAWPISYFVIHKWLQNFAYRTEMNLFVFVLSGLLLFVIAGLTISFQTIQASRKNPVDCLRYE
jgi:putative ABC transport system permease protein